MGEMRDSGKETGPHRSFVPPRPSSSLQPPLLPFSPPPHSLSLSLSIALSPGPCPPPDCPLFINAIKETECRASTVGFLPCRCREPAVRSGRIYAGKRIHHSRRQLARRGLSIPNSHRENRTFRPFSTVFNPPTIPMNNLYPSMLFHITSIHDFYAKIFICIYFCISSRYKNLYLAYFISRRNDTNAKIAS